jgi:hypothetical protein
MAYSTTDLIGLTAYAKSVAIGKYYFEGKFADKKTVQAGVEIGVLKGSLVAEDGNTVLSVADAAYGSLYYLNRKIYLKDGFGNRLESNDDEEWEIVGVEDITDTPDIADTGWGNTLPKNNGILGGISDVLKNAGDLLKKTPTVDLSIDNTPLPKSNSNVLKYVIIGAIVALAILIIYLLVKKPKDMVQQMMQVASPQADVPSPVLAGLPKRN